MKFLAVATALFAGTSLAVPTNNNNGGGACVPNRGGNNPGGNNNPGDDYPNYPGDKYPGGNPSTGPGGYYPGSRTHTRTHTRTHPGSHTSSGPATTTTGSNTGSSTSSGPTTTNTGSTPGGEFKCPAGLYSNAQCCSTDVLGVLGLDCANPSRAPTSGDDFKGICAAVGKQAKCCVLPAAGQDVLCQDAIPGGPTSSGPGSNPTSSNPGGNPTSTQPTGGGPTNHPDEFHCPAGLYSNAQCCATDVLGIADINCANPSRTPISGDDFKAICGAAGKQAKCCVLPVAGQDVLCQDAIGGNPPSSQPGGSNPTSTQPTGGGPTQPPGDANGTVCPKGLYSNPQCCSTDVLGVADLDCSNPSNVSNPKAFGASCAAGGKQAKCCVLPVAGQSALCQDAIGAN